jgi:competence protein ComEC
LFVDRNIDFYKKEKMRKYFLIGSILFFLLGCILAYQAVIYNDKKLHIVICDVGQGDAIFIRTPGGVDVLIDGGPDNSVLDCLSSHMPLWDRTIEIMILTHPHVDHLAGLIDVAKRYRVIVFGSEKIVNPSTAYKELVKQLERNRTKQKSLYRDDQFVVKDGVILKTLWPTMEWVEQNPIGEGSSDINGSSVIGLLNYKNFKALFAGDAQASIINQIDSMAGGIDLLKVPHHSSKTGLNANILNILNPKIAVISVGAKNKYGHPAPFTLNLLNQFNIKTLRTDQTGDIEIISDGNSWMVK